MKERVGEGKLVIGLISMTVSGTNDRIRFYRQTHTDEEVGPWSEAASTYRSSLA